MALNIQRKWTTIKLFSRLKLVEKAKVVFRLHGVVSAFKIIHFTPFCFRSVECKNVYMFGFFFLTGHALEINCFCMSFTWKRSI